MKTVLHLFTKESETSQFFHLVNDLLVCKVGDQFDYNQYFRLLNESELKDFKRKNLQNGFFKVTDIFDDENQNLRIVYLKPN